MKFQIVQRCGFAINDLPQGSA